MKTVGIGARLGAHLFGNSKASLELDVAVCSELSSS